MLCGRRSTTGYRPLRGPPEGCSGRLAARRRPAAIAHRIHPVHPLAQKRGAPAHGLPPCSALQRLRRCCGLAALCLASITSNAQAAPTALAQLTGETGQAALAEQVLAAVNQYRAQQALVAWLPDDALAAIAREHSRLMAQRTELGHDGFDGRFQQARSKLCVETLAAGFSDAVALVRAWRLSPTHHANLLEPRARRAGVAAVDGYVTLLACD
jgi:hypothetical protein